MIQKIDVWESVCRGNALMPTVDEWFDVREMYVDLLNVFAKYKLNDEAIECSHQIAYLDEQWGYCQDDINLVDTE